PHSKSFLKAWLLYNALHIIAQLSNVKIACITQIYQSQDPHSAREYFDFEPSIDPSTQDYVTITPALLKGDRLLRRGRVIEPAYSELKES
ncbi:MAG: hypothetical protein MUD14_13355, partial [Hydrococcus sp. Prado102]|nr:hypothetical protein [Hydrococcus sp. Prado102]